MSAWRFLLPVQITAAFENRLYFLPFLFADLSETKGKLFSFQVVIPFFNILTFSKPALLNALAFFMRSLFGLTYHNDGGRFCIFQ